MSFTIMLAVFALLGLAVIFGVTYKRKGLNFALITTGIALVVFGALYIATIYVITSAMS